MDAERTPEEYRSFFAEVFAALDAAPRMMKVKVFAEGLTIDLVEGNPVFKTAVLLGGIYAGDGSGYSKKESHQAASKKAYERLKQETIFREQVLSSSQTSLN